MGRISFKFLDRMRSEDILPQMFDILFTNMNKIAPTGNSYEDDKKTWLSNMISAQRKEGETLLMYVGETLVGYFQYRIDRDVMLIEEIEILPDYQRTTLFYSFVKFAANIVPPNIVHLEAYVNKSNLNSQGIAEKLGMKIVGENKNGLSWHYQGELTFFNEFLK